MSAETSNCDIGVKSLMSWSGLARPKLLRLRSTSSTRVLFHEKPVGQAVI
jgi:hypothetical protein